MEDCNTASGTNLLACQVAPPTLGGLGRVQQVIGARMGLVSTSSVRVPTVQEASVPLDLNSNTKLQALQCGYYDAGSAAGHALVQPGCVYQQFLKIQPECGKVLRELFPAVSPSSRTPNEWRLGS